MDGANQKNLPLCDCNGGTSLRSSLANFHDRPTAVIGAHRAALLRCRGAMSAPTSTPQRVRRAATATCFLGGLGACSKLDGGLGDQRGPRQDHTALLQRSRRPHGAPAATNGDLADFCGRHPV